MASFDIVTGPFLIARKSLLEIARLTPVACVPLLLVAERAQAIQTTDRSVPSITATAVDVASIDVDGRLTEAVWRTAVASGGFTQRDPDDGAAATESTTVRVLYSSESIYVGIRAYDSEPAEIRSTMSRRDRARQTDGVEIFFDSYHDKRSSFGFAVSPSGSFEDAYRQEDRWGGADYSWDPVWKVATTTDSIGWVAEFEIPFNQLRFDNQSTTWGLQVSRWIERKAEGSWWAPFSQQSSGFASLFGVLDGLENLPSLMRLEIRPYVVADGRRRPEGTGSRYIPGSQAGADAGLDIKYGLTSDFTVDATVNPDFGQIEADPSVVNLTAFETFFPERRPFFIEGGGLFNRSMPGGQLFYSRRIGRRPQGFTSPPDGGTVEIPDAARILGAAKVTGKSSGGLGLGLLSALTSRSMATLRDSNNVVVGDGKVEPLTHYFAGQMVQRGKGGIINLASGAAEMVSAYNANYCATKAYDLKLSEALWAELKPMGIDVLGFMPGSTNTEGYVGEGGATKGGMVMGVEETVAEALHYLGRRPSVVAGRNNRIINYLFTHILSRARMIGIASAQVKKMFKVAD